MLFWFVPFFSSAMIVGWFIELAEHFPLMQRAENTLQSSRNRHGNWLERFFTAVHFDNYHQEHHLNPAVPFWNLRKSNLIHMRDSTYSAWDSRWGGIFSERTGDRQTVLEFLLAWCKDKGSYEN